MTLKVFASYDIYSGLDAAKPVAPAPADGRLAVYQASDSGTTYVWNAAAGAWFAGPSVPVSSVFGRTGAVVAAANDYSFSEISGSVADGQLSTNVPLLNGSNVFTASLLLENLSATASLMTTSNSAANFSNILYSNTAASSPTYNVERARGTLASPAVVQTGDALGSITFRGYGSSAFEIGAFIRAYCIDTSPSNTAMGTSIRFQVAPIGGVVSGTADEVFRIEVATGLTMYGNFPIVDGNRLFILRNIVVASLPSSPAIGATAFVTDSTLPIGTGLGITVVGGGSHGVPVFYDGASWKIG